VTGQWFSPGTPVSFTNKTDHHDITEILLKVALNTITLTPILMTVSLFITRPTHLVGFYSGSSLSLWVRMPKNREKKW
jgi:hypothetical protein